jgi:acetylornithine deacetylase/succinyl-diaminopimelate desuccinylase-like protein
MLLLKRSGAKLDRDVIFLAEAGEEATTKPGIEFMVNRHLDAIDAEFALTEGGGATIDNGRVTYVSIQTTEKVPRAVRLVANGTSGHASIPRVDNPLIRLAAAVQKVGTWQTPMRMNDTTRTYFEKLAAVSPPDKADRYKGLFDPARSAAVQQYLRVNEPEQYSMLRTSVVPTILNAGFRVNVIPSEAEATVDIRALPDENVPQFFEAMAKVIDDPAVKIEPDTKDQRPFGAPSRLDNDMFRALEKAGRSVYGVSAVLPVMSTGATDMSYLRPKGIQSYGIGPARTDSDRVSFGAHGDVERILESSLYSLVEFTWDAVTEVAVGK